MNTRLLMRASAIFMGAVGLAATFAPQEIIAYAGGQAGTTGVLGVQVAGALYVGFALLDWMAQGNLIGGIYSRPVAVGNLVHFAIAAIAMLKAVAAGTHTTPVVAATSVYTLFAVLFGRVVFGKPPS